jgi:hypothetical protein
VIFTDTTTVEAGKLVVPQRETETFISTIGHLDGRVDLYKGQSLLQENGDSVLGERSTQVEMGNRALMDLCIMASKLAYENAEVVRNIVVHHWKASYTIFVFPLFSILYFSYIGRQPI